MEALIQKIADDTALSIKEKGFLLEMATRPKGFKFSIETMVELSSDQATCIANTFNQLIKKGYIERVRQLSGNRFNGYKYYLRKHK